MNNIKFQFYKSVIIFFSFIFFFLFFLFLNFKYSNNINGIIYAKKEITTYQFFDKKENDLSNFDLKIEEILQENMNINIDYKNQHLIIPKYSKIINFQVLKIKNKFLHLIIVESYDFLNHTIIIDDIKNLSNIENQDKIDIFFYKLKILKVGKINKIITRDRKIIIDIQLNDEMKIEKSEIIIKL